MNHDDIDLIRAKYGISFNEHVFSSTSHRSDARIQRWCSFCGCAFRQSLRGKPCPNRDERGNFKKASEI